MSEGPSALAGAVNRGVVLVEDAGLRGMITLRGDQGLKPLRDAVREAVGQEVPGQRGVAAEGEQGVAWMSPDELLLMVPYDEAGPVSARLQAALAEEFALVVDVSDARAVFRLQGPAWRDVLARLCPVDFAGFGPGEIRRTRAAQAAVAFWMSGPDEITLVCFRSVSEYVFDLMCTAARPGSEVGLYR